MSEGTVMTPSLSIKQANVFYEAPVSCQGDGVRHRFVRVRVEGLDSKNRALLDKSMFGVRRIVSLKPQAVELPCTVVWNGDREHPELVFDGWVDTCWVEVEVWGF